jgi:hypothetical protein
MDMLRSCYSTEMEFFDPAQGGIPVTWYFCKEGANSYPGYTRFASGNWASSRIGWPGPGEVEGAPRPWSDGDPPFPPTVTEVAHADYVGIAPDTNTVTSGLPLPLSVGQTVIVVIWYRVTAGAGAISSVSDTSGNTYQIDFRRQCVTDTSLRIEVWRASIGGADVDAAVVLNFPGLSGFFSFRAIAFTGIDKNPVVATRGNTGISTALPTVENPKTDHGWQIAIAILGCGGIVGPLIAPSGFTSDLSVVTHGLHADGNLSHLVFSRAHQAKKISWDSASHGDWVTGAVVYRGKPIDVPPGIKTCGPDDFFEHGAPVDAKPVCADVYGRVSCCWDFLQHFNCCDATDIPDNLKLTFVGVHFPNIDTPVYVGLTLDVLPGGPTAGWTVQTPGGAGFLYFNCGFPLWGFDRGLFPDVSEKTFQPQGPAGGFNFYVYGIKAPVSFPPNLETWDVWVHVKGHSPPPPPPPPPDSYWGDDYLPPGYFPNGFAP